MMQEAIREALLAPEGDPGEIAGSAMLQLAQDRGLETETHKVYDSVIHHANIADLVATLLRKPGEPPWRIPESMDNWIPGCYLSAGGDFLRRVVLVTHWNDERHISECRSWFTLGEQAHYELPMQLAVIILGQQRDGQRIASPWATGFLHPLNHELRFRKRDKGVRQPGNIFGETWQRIHREDHDEISRETWLESMLKDDVLYEVCFREDIPLPNPAHLVRVRDMASTKLERLYGQRGVPEANLSSCDWPIPCPFRKCCHTLPEAQPEEKYGFIQIERRIPLPKVGIPTSVGTLPGPG
jgi:hypothetical protein